jgi:hypothetical protein
LLLHSNDNALLGEADDYQRTLYSASLVLGFHPDQATEAIVDFAVAARKPFAVVPCCVFGRDFPNRRLCDGTAVTSIEHFLQYLQEKDSGIRIADLPYVGRNRVLYRFVW